MKSTVKKLALIGPWANATTQMQGNYAGVAPFLVSPLQGAVNAGYQTTCVPRTVNVTSTDTSGFAAAVTAAKAADVVIFAGGIDNTVESEGMDRTAIVWPGNQLALISALETVGKSLVILQFGGGQIDDSALKANSSVSVVSSLPLYSMALTLSKGKRYCMGRISWTKRWNSHL